MATQRANSFGNNIKNLLDADSQNIFNKARSLLINAETRRSIIVNKNLDDEDYTYQKEPNHINLIDANTETSVNALIKKNPNNSDANWLFGMLCAHQYKYSVSDKKRKKKDKKAIKFYEKCLKLNPHHAECYCSYGILLFELDKINKSDEMFKKCLHIDSCNHRGNFHYAEYWRLKGSYDYAEKFYQAAIENNNNNIINSYHHVGYGEFLTCKRRHQDAEKQFLNAQKLNPNNDIAYYFYAQLLKQTGKITFAIANIKTAIKYAKRKQYFKFLHGLNLLKPKVPIQFIECTSLSKSPSHSETTASNHSESKNNLNINEAESKDNINIPLVIKQNVAGNMEQIENDEHNLPTDICEIEFKRFLNAKIQFDQYYPDLYKRFEQAQCNSIRFLLDIDEQLLQQQIKMKPIHCKIFCKQVKQFECEVHEFRDWLRNVITESHQFPVDSLIELFGDNGIWTHESFHRNILSKQDLNSVVGEIYSSNNINIINAIWDAVNGAEGSDEMVDMLRNYAFPILDDYFKGKNMNNPLIEYHNKIIDYFKKENIYCNSLLNIKQEQFVSNLCIFIGTNDDTNYKSALNHLYRIIDCQKEMNCFNSKELEGVHDDENMLSFKVSLQEIIKQSDINIKNQVAEIMNMFENANSNIDITTYPLWNTDQSVNGCFNSSGGITNNNQNSSDHNQPYKYNQNNNNGNNSGNGNGNGNGNNNFYELYYNKQICNREECVANRSLLMLTNQQLYDKQIETSQLCQYIQKLLEENMAFKNNITQLIHGNHTPKQQIKTTNKSKRRKSKIVTTMGITGNVSSYEPNALLRAKKRNVKIEKALTAKIIPVRIQHKIVDLKGNSMVYKYIDKSIAMLNYDNNKFMSECKYDEVILDFDFIDKINKERLYCKMNKYSKGVYKWQIMNKLFTKKDIGHNVLLCSSRKKK
eukprot:117447_1